MSTATPSEQRDHYQNVIDDLKRQIHRRDDSIQVHTSRPSSFFNIQISFSDTSDMLIPMT